MFCVICYMNINDYLDKLRSKPVHERQRIAVVATGVAFAVIFLIWIVSFSEMNNSVETQAEQQAPEDNFSAEKASIEEMLQGLSEEEMGIEEEVSNQDAEGMQSEGTGEELQNQDTSSTQDNQLEIPQLP